MMRGRGGRTAGEPMGGGVRRHEGGAGAAERQRELAGVLDDVGRLWRAGTEEELTEASGPVIDRLGRVEAALAEHGEDFSLAFVVLGLVLGMRCNSRREHAPSESDAADRAEALRRLRWTDRRAPADDRLAVQARMMLVFLLTPWAVPRADGTTTVLRDALLTAGKKEGVLTESLRRDLEEAKEVVGRIAAAPLDAELRRQTANVGQVIERMLAPGVDLADPPAGTEATDAGATDAGATDAAGAARDGDGPDDAGNPDDADGPPDPDDPEEALLDAVRGLVDLAGARSTAQFTRILVWLRAALEPRARGPQPPVLEQDPQAAALLRRAAAGSAAGTDGVRRAADLVLRALHALPPDAPERGRVARLHAHLLVVLELLADGSADFSLAERPAPDPADDSRDRLDDWPLGLTLEPGLAAFLNGALRDFALTLGVYERHHAAHVERLLAYRTGDTGYLNDAAALLKEAIDGSPPDSWWVVTLRVDLAEVLEQAALHGGSFQDADSSLAALRELGARLRRDGSLPLDAPFTLELLLSTADLELSHVKRTGDHGALPPLIEELRARHTALPADSTWRGKLARRLEELEQLGGDGRQASRGAVPEPLDVAAELADLGRAVEQAQREQQAPAAYRQQEYDRCAALGLRLFLSVKRGLNHPVLLDGAISRLTRARTLLAEGRGEHRRVDVLTKLAEAHMMRAATRTGPHARADEQAFLEVSREALDELAADVLLQTGADHGLSAALNGDLLAERLAWAALILRRPADAVADLEKGRGLVHQAAVASRGIPRLLDAAGHPELARRWRAHVRTGPPRLSPDAIPLHPAGIPRTPDAPLRPAGSVPPTGSPTRPAGGPPIPSALRREALAVLGVRARPGQGRGVRQMAGTADVAALTEGLAASGTDALVYLVPGTPLPHGAFPGHALILRPGAAPAMLPLPELIRPGSEPLERYLDAAARRSRALADPHLHVSWKSAYDEHWQVMLRELCDWAWPAVMGPVLSAVRPSPSARRPQNRPPRIVLVPCGLLGVVPWHAARTGSAGGQGHRYACEEAVISYAPSGAGFLAAAGRRRMSPADGRQVLVADPELTLPWAEVEAEALRAACYPGALRYGEFLGTDEAPDAAGTPAELLAVLPGGTAPASVVHLACHARAAPRPTDSALRLAGAPGADRDTGRLTVAGILDAAADVPPDSAGPLVVLSACETDLSTRDHDEALTLATALVTSGAADVVGSRWAVRDGPTAVMMAVFHHHLTAGGLAPPDALRAAQSWMLDPHRSLPFPLDAPLRDEAARCDLHHVHHWAAFTHQGNPAPAVHGTGPGQQRHG
ncbi:CHAT domain-containing protein [Streptomyces sp. NRRL B-3648]|uniref:CHAT domain-containing protein n=1 Tax=Streptomyces sp. NRRL B-3648 TaxID=1519493 RepID=UPI00131DCAD3|nr:CHAT domain-containing protein [Streptomyces sp. NRRL B-3648]